MADLLKLVEKELLSDKESKDVVPLWHEIYAWHEAGGPENVESNLMARLKEGESAVSKNIKGISPEIKPAKKKTKRRK